MKTKQGLLNAVNNQIRELQALANSIEISEEPDLRPLSELADVLKTRRKQLNLSRNEVSELCGIAPNTYRALEMGEGNPTVQTLKSVSEVLNFRVWVELP